MGTRHCVCDRPVVLRLLRRVQNKPVGLIAFPKPQQVLASYKVPPKISLLLDDKRKIKRLSFPSRNFIRIDDVIRLTDRFKRRIIEITQFFPVESIDVLSDMWLIAHRAFTALSKKRNVFKLKPSKGSCICADGQFVHLRNHSLLRSRCKKLFADNYTRI